MRYSLAMKCNSFRLFKTIGLCFVFFVFGNSQIVGQESQNEQPIKIMKGQGYMLWADNMPNSYVTLKFPGETFEPAQVELGFTMDSTRFYQILKHEYTAEQYTNKADSLQEEALLKYYQKYEQDYLEEEVFKEKLEVTDQYFYNSDGKKFHVYYFPTPDGFIEKEEGSSYASHHFYLNFIANQYVYGLYTVAMDYDDFQERLATIKGIAESADIFGGAIDIDAMSYRLYLEAEGHEKGMEFVNPLGKYVLDIPDWFNVCKAPNDSVFIGTLPDNNNVKNAISITHYPKEEYESFNVFNQKMVTNLAIGDSVGTGTVLIKNELETPENSDGVAYKLQIMNQGSMYEIQYVTYQTEETFLLVNFTATPETYDKNVSQFREFLTGISWDLEEDSEDSKDDD